MSTETRCRSCGSSDLEPILDLGFTPLANRLLSERQLAEPEPRHPLVLVFCGACSLLQIGETISPEELFSDYVYFSSFSETVLTNAREVARDLCAERRLSESDLVVEIASNDGYLLQFYRDAGVPVLGIEPAQNIAAEARGRGIDTLAEFFGLELAVRLRQDGIRAAVIHANNVLAHVADLNGFVAGVATILDPSGIASIEVPYARDMIENCEFDTIYHEHLCYYSVTALRALFDRHALALVDVKRIPIHGGSLRLTVAHQGTPPSESVAAILAEEAAWGVANAQRYIAFARRVETLRRDLVALLGSLKSSGARLAAYGASAKGATLLNYCEIGRDVLEFVVDRSTVKQGLFTPGTHLPIVSPDVLETNAPDYLLLLTWNHAAEILRQQHGYLARGGRFIVPIPEPGIVA